MRRGLREYNSRISLVSRTHLHDRDREISFLSRRVVRALSSNLLLIAVLSSVILEQRLLPSLAQQPRRTKDDVGLSKRIIAPIYESLDSTKIKAVSSSSHSSFLFFIFLPPSYSLSLSHFLLPSRSSRVSPVLRPRTHHPIPNDLSAPRGPLPARASTSALSWAGTP